MFGISEDVLDLIHRYPGELPPDARIRVERELESCSFNQGVIKVICAAHSLDPSRPPEDKVVLDEANAAWAENDHRREACKGLLSAIRRFPPEIHLEVFRYYLTTPPFWDYLDINEIDIHEIDEEQKAKPHLGTLREVCRMWDSVVMNAPSLWTNSVTLYGQRQEPGFPPLSTLDHCTVIAVWMNNAGESPKSLNIHTLGMGSASRTADDIVKVSDALQQGAFQMARPRRLKITADAFALGLGEVSFPDVTSIVVRSYDPDLPGSQPHDPILPDMPSLPALTHAVLDNVLPDYSISTASVLPWENLTHLHLGKITVAQFRAIVRFCDSLQEGCFQTLSTITDTLDDSFYARRPGVITLRSLRELTILEHSPFTDPLAALRLPVLTKMRTIGNQGCTEIAPANLPLFENLTHLTLIATQRMDAEELIPTLREMTRLEELFCRLTDGMEEVFKFLTYGVGYDLGDGHEKAHEKYNLPCLKAITEEDEDFLFDEDLGKPTLELPYEMLAEMISSRTRCVQDGVFLAPSGQTRKLGVARLEQLVIHASDLPDHPEQEILVKLKEVFKPFREVCGLGGRVYGKWPAERTTYGEAPIPKYLHWDEGFMDFMDADEWSLYPEYVGLMADDED